MALFLNNEDVKQVLTMAMTLQALEESYRQAIVQIDLPTYLLTR